MVDSPRLEEVTCQGLRVRQTGLPADTTLEVEVSDPRSGRELARREARSDAAGTLDTRVVARFDGAMRLAVEVEREAGGEELELAESIHEFDRPCPDGTAGRSHAGRSGVMVAAVAAAAVLAAGLVAGGWALGVLRHPGGG
jgi:hypothetical protein